MTETIDVGPVYCPSCKREYGNTEAEALREALRIAVEGLDELTARFDGDEALVGSPLLNARTALAAVRELVDLGEKP